MKRSNLGPLIAQIIKRRKFKQNELCRHVGMSPSQISNFLQGKTDIRTSTFFELLKTLQIDLIKLLRIEATQQDSLQDSLSAQTALLPPSESETLRRFIHSYKDRFHDHLYVERNQKHGNE